MKSENKVKKLVLRRETLRDLTAQNAGGVKGGGSGKGAGCFTNGSCFYSCAGCSQSCGAVSCGCHGHTYNKKCVR